MVDMRVNLMQLLSGPGHAASAAANGERHRSASADSNGRPADLGGTARDLESRGRDVPEPRATPEAAQAPHDAHGHDSHVEKRASQGRQAADGKARDPEGRPRPTASGRSNSRAAPADTGKKVVRSRTLAEAGATSRPAEKNDFETIVRQLLEKVESNETGVAKALSLAGAKGKVAPTAPAERQTSSVAEAQAAPVAEAQAALIAAGSPVGATAPEAGPGGKAAAHRPAVASKPAAAPVVTSAGSEAHAPEAGGPAKPTAVTPKAPAASFADKVDNVRTGSDGLAVKEPPNPEAVAQARRGPASPEPALAPRAAPRAAAAPLPGRQVPVEQAATNGRPVARTATVARSIAAQAGRHAASSNAAGDPKPGNNHVLNSLAALAPQGAQVEYSPSSGVQRGAEVQTAPPEQPAPLPPAEQVIEAIRARGVQGGEQIVVRLNPPQLGRVRLTVRSDAQGLHGVLEVDNPKTLLELQRETSALIDRLADGGVDLRRLDVQLGDQGRDASADSMPQPGADGGQGADGRQGDEPGGKEPAGPVDLGPTDADEGDLPGEVRDDSINVWM